MSSWDDTYKKHGTVQHSIRSDVIEMVNVFKANQRYEKISKYRVLDHCCGTGRHVQYLAREGFDVVGLDNSEEALKITIQQYKEFGNIRLVLSEMNEIPFSDKYFNGAISILGIHFGNKEQREGAFRSLRKVLKKGSPFYLAVLSKNHRAYGLGDSVDGDLDSFENIPGIHAGMRHFYDKDELERILPGFGFEVDSISEYTEPLKEGSFFKYPLYECRVLCRRR